MSNLPKNEKGSLPRFIDPNDLLDVLDSNEEVPAAAATDDPDPAEDLEDEIELSYEDGLSDGINSASSFTELNEDSVLEKREDTRSRLALIYTLATFFVFVLGMLIAVLDGLNRDVSIIENLSEIIPLISGVFLGSLGFVLGYYFRKGDEE